jgi:thioredoxin 1
MKTITAEQFKDEVKNFKGVVMVDFFAEWCGPCKMLSPLLEELDSANTDSSVKYLKIDVDANQELAASFGIMSIPTVLLFRDGELAGQKVGVAGKDAYLQAIAEAKNFDPAAPQEIMVFSTPTCPYCTMAKNYLREKGISFKDVDVSADETMARKMMERSGRMGVPQLWIKNQVVIGFNKPLIDQLLGS